MKKALVSASPSPIDVAGLVDHEEVAGPQLAPVRTVRVEQEPAGLAGNGQAEVVVDALVEAVQHRGAEDHGELDTGALTGVHEPLFMTGPFTMGPS